MKQGILAVEFGEKVGNFPNLVVFARGKHPTVHKIFVDISQKPSWYKFFRPVMILRQSNSNLSHCYATTSRVILSDHQRVEESTHFVSCCG